MPTITVQPDPTSGIDTSLTAALPTYNIGTLVAAYCYTGGTMLLKPPVDDIPAGATIDSWSLTVRPTFAAPATVTAYRMLVDWIEGTKNQAQATEGEPCWSWREYDTVAWGAPGARGDGTDRDAAPIGTQSMPALGVNYTIDLDPATLQGWLDGTLPRYGFQLVGSTTVQGQLLTSDYTANVALRPKYTITYTEPSGTPPRRRYAVLDPFAPTRL
jgi:hypothetical protein